MKTAKIDPRNQKRALEVTPLILMSSRIRAQETWMNPMSLQKRLHKKLQGLLLATMHSKLIGFM